MDNFNKQEWLNKHSIVTIEQKVEIPVNIVNDIFDALVTGDYLGRDFVKYEIVRGIEHGCGGVFRIDTMSLLKMYYQQPERSRVTMEKFIECVQGQVKKFARCGGLLSLWELFFWSFNCSVAKIHIANCNSFCEGDVEEAKDFFPCEFCAGETKFIQNHFNRYHY